MADTIIRVTEKALEKIHEIQQEQNHTGSALRVAVNLPSPAAFSYDLSFVENSRKSDEDLTQEVDGLVIYVDRDSLPRIQGATVDYVENLSGSGFKIDNPNQPPLMSNPVAQKVQKVLEEKINPGVASHGGYVSLIDVQEGRVFVQLGGGCQGCGMANVTLKSGIETMLKTEIPEVKEVLDTTDHAAGTNPYFRPGKGSPPA